MTNEMTRNMRGGLMSKRDNKKGCEVHLRSIINRPRRQVLGLILLSELSINPLRFCLSTLADCSKFSLVPSPRDSFQPATDKAIGWGDHNHAYLRSSDNSSVEIGIAAEAFAVLYSLI